MTTDPFSLDGAVAAVTGAGRGIGRVIACQLARLGAAVAVADVDGDAAGAAEEEARDLGGAAIAVTADVTTVAGAAALVEAAERRFGGLDVLVNNVGGSVAPDGEDGAALERSLEATLRLCVHTTVFCSRAAVAAMRRRGGGRIVNVGSVYGRLGPAPELAAVFGEDELLFYAAAKGALVGLTRAQAVRWAPDGIRVNVVVPGHVAAGQPMTPERRAAWSGITGATPLGRMGTPEDVAQAVAFLAAPASAYVTGEALAVDGGWSAR